MPHGNSKRRGTGSIDAGKAADLVLVKGKPAPRTADIGIAVLVFKNGVGCAPC